MDYTGASSRVQSLKLHSHIPRISAPTPNWRLLVGLLRPDVHIKYASHAHLDLLFDIYCRRIQAWWGFGWWWVMDDVLHRNLTSIDLTLQKKGVYHTNLWFTILVSDISLFQWFHFRGVVFLLCWRLIPLLGCLLTKGQESNLAHLRNSYKLWKQTWAHVFWIPGSLPGSWRKDYMDSEVVSSLESDIYLDPFGCHRVSKGRAS